MTLRDPTGGSEDRHSTHPGLTCRFAFRVLLVAHKAGLWRPAGRAKLNLEREPVRTFLMQMDAYINSLDGDIEELKRIAAEKKAILDSGGSLRGGGR